MVVTYSPEGRDLYIYFTTVNPGVAERSLPEVPMRMLFDAEHQWIGFEIIEPMPDGSVIDLVPALTHVRKNAPEITTEHDERRNVLSFRWALEEPASVLPWDAILDFDGAGHLIGIEFLFGGALEIENRLGRLDHQRI
jgi:hypothetical protein